MRHIISSRARWRRQLKGRAAARSSALDAALDMAGAEVAAGEPFAAERLAARALALTVVMPEPPPGPLMALRAGLAASRANRREVARRRVRLSLQMSSAAAMVVVVVMAALSSLPPSGSQGDVAAVELRATDVLQILSQRMEDVRSSVDAGDREMTRANSAAAATVLVQARQTAKLLPPGNPVRDKVMAKTLDQISELQGLVTQLQLEVPPLQAPVTGAGSSTTSTAGAAGTGTGSNPALGVPPVLDVPALLVPGSQEPTTTTSTTKVPDSPPTTNSLSSSPTTVPDPTGSSTTTSSTSTTTTTKPPTTTTTTRPPTTTTTAQPSGVTASSPTGTSSTTTTTVLASRTADNPQGARPWSR